jgi:serine/threonine protein kinase
MTDQADVTRLGKYEIVRVIGRGGGGMVYEALHPELRKRVAVKTLHRTLAESSDFLRRFLREGEAASRIRHPHVVDITDFGVHEGIPFLVMELLEGQNLRAYLAQRGRLALGEAVDLLLPVIAAVGAGHDAGVVHRDLKPPNVFVSTVAGVGLHAKVLDFGVSKLLGTPAGGPQTDPNLLVGTVSYMAPEQVRGSKNIDARVDQYALGLILHECLTGKRVFESKDQLAVMHDAIRAPAVEPPLPPLFQAALMKALAKNPDDRFPTVYAFGRALLPFAGERVRTFWRLAFELRSTEKLRPVRDREPLRPTLELSIDPSIHIERRPAAVPVLPASEPARGTYRRSLLAWLSLGGVAALAGAGLVSLAVRSGRKRPAAAPPLPAVARANAPAPPTIPTTKPPTTPAISTTPASSEPAMLASDEEGTMPRRTIPRKAHAARPSKISRQPTYQMGANRSPIITD